MKKKLAIAIGVIIAVLINIDGNHETIKLKNNANDVQN